MRKQPRQDRSRATVEAIVEAGAQVLGRNGWSGFTTNHVAQIAGVSIGSLYQYFPNKRALVAAIRLRHFDDVLGAVRAAADGAGGMRQRIERLIDGLIEVHTEYPELHRALVEEVAADRESRVAHDAFEREYLRSYRRLLARCGARVGEGGVHVLSAAMEGAVHDAARRGALRAPATRAELLRLASAYLGSSP